MDTPDALVTAIQARADEARFTILEVNDRTIKSVELRRVVLREIRLLTEYVIEVLETVRERGVVVNEQWLEKLDEMYHAVVNGKDPG